MTCHMRIRLILALLLLPACIYAQERFPVRGRIVDEKGEAVEYVHVGIPRLGIGTVSTVDGLFEIEVPADTLEFHHVSYQTGYYPVSAPDNDLIIVPKESELPPAVFIGGDTKEKYLLRPGTRFVGAQGGFNARDGIDKGKEVGSVASRESRKSSSTSCTSPFMPMSPYPTADRISTSNPKNPFCWNRGAILYPFLWSTAIWTPSAGFRRCLSPSATLRTWNYTPTSISRAAIIGNPPWLGSSTSPSTSASPSRAWSTSRTGIHKKNAHRSER